MVVLQNHARNDEIRGKQKEGEGRGMKWMETEAMVTVQW